MAGLGMGAKLICIGNPWPRVSSSSLRGHLSRALMSSVLQLSLLSHPSLSWGRGTPLGAVGSSKCSWVSWGAMSAASHLTSPFPKRCCIFIHSETLNYVDLSSCLSYNDPRFFSRNVCALQEELISCFPSTFHSLSLSIFCPVTTVTNSVMRGEEVRLKNMRGLQDFVCDLTWSKR